MSAWDAFQTHVSAAWAAEETYSGMKGSKMKAIAANPNCEQNTARYAHRVLAFPVELTMMKATRGPMP